MCLIVCKFPTIYLHPPATSFLEFQVVNSGVVLSLVVLAWCPRIPWTLHQEAVSFRCTLDFHLDNSKNNYLYREKNIFYNYLDRSEGSHNSRGPESMCDERKVSEVSLDVGVQDHGWLGVTQGRAILIEEVHQLLGDQAGGQEQLLPPELFRDVRVPPGEELRHLLGGKLGLAHVAKVSSQMNGLACGEIC